MKKIITTKSEKFLEKYLNNPSPTGFESEGQKYGLSTSNPMWMITLRTAMGLWPGLLTQGRITKWSLRHMPMKSPGLSTTSQKKGLFISCEMEDLIT